MKLDVRYRGPRQTFTESVAFPFWSAQYELVEGCNRSCAFCGIFATREKKNWHVYKYMPLELVDGTSKEIAEINPRARIELNNHGEPSLHPELHEAVRIIRKNGPEFSIQIQTNAEVFWRSDPDTEVGLYAILAEARRLFCAGLNTFALNAYHFKLYNGMEELRRSGKAEAALNMGMPFIVRVANHYYDNPEKINIYHNNSGSKNFVLLDDLDRVERNHKDKQTYSKIITNEGGNTLKEYIESRGLQKQLPLNGKPCSRPFREITFGYNGLVSACCYDWRNGIVLGKFPEMSVKEIWNSPAAHALRWLLAAGRGYRNMSPCDKCNYNGGGRIGLLPKPDIPEFDNDPGKADKVLLEWMENWKEFQYPGQSYHVNGTNYNTPTETLEEFLKTNIESG
jgi:MoaA/NifB/PqqE/SkfB family radical SAM enzyme